MTNAKYGSYFNRLRNRIARKKSLTLPMSYPDKMNAKYRFYVNRLRRKLSRKKALYGAMMFMFIIWISSSDDEANIVQKSLNIFVPGFGYGPGMTFALNTAQCYSSSQDHDITGDVFTSEVLDCLLIKYPAAGGLYPRGFLRPDVTEFVHRTNETPGFDKLPLDVVVVPHVHLEAGWLKTYSDYSTEYIDRILKNTMEKLNMYPDLTFTWIETNFLYQWWKDQPDSVKELFLSLVQGGRIEIASGMWVSPDEATPHYFSLIDQMIEGHYWVKNVLGVIPETTVSFDQAGYSASMPYLSKKAGIKHMVMKRVNHAVKDLMGSKRWMTFEWRQLWDRLGEDDIMGHIEQYEGITVSDSCGPMRGVCKELDSIRMKDFPLPGSAAAMIEIGINKYNNFDELTDAIVGELKKKALNYEEKVLLIPYGGEFYYHEKWHWDKIYRNLKILMNYINQKRSKYNVNIQFGTLKDYFGLIDQQREDFNITFPVISGDFFSYTKMSQYWTGYFTTRMFDKRLSREVQESLRAAEMLTTIVMHNEEFSAEKKSSLLSQLVEARQNLGLFLHHQAITGTSQANVVIDYEKRLTSAFTSAQSVLASVTSFLVQTKEAETQGITFEPYLFRTSHNTLTEERPIQVSDKGTQVVLVNSLTQARTEIIQLLVKSPAVSIVDPEGYSVKFDVEDVGEGNSRVSFEAFLQPVGLTIYTIKSGSRRYPIDKLEPRTDKFVCENVYMNATFSKSNGTLLGFCDKLDRKCLRVLVDWVKYPGNTGAYIMDSNTTETAFSSTPTVKAVKGTKTCRVTASYDKLQVDYILPITQGVSGMAIKVEVKSNLPSDYNGDLAMRFKTSIRNTDFYADSNGFQMMRRKFRKHIPYGGNIYPMTSMAFIESMNVRMILHSAQPHGVISSKRYTMDVFVDRVAPAPENGLPEGATDNKPTKTLFFLEMESLVDYIKPRIVEGMLPSINTVFLSDTLQHPVYSFTTSDESAKNLPTERTFLRQPLPCDVIVANARTLASSDNKPQGTSLTLFRRAISCTEKPSGAFCPLINPMKINVEQLFGKVNTPSIKVTEMFMSQLKEKPKQLNMTSIHIKPMDIRTFLLTKGSS